MMWTPNPAFTSSPIVTDCVQIITVLLMPTRLPMRSTPSLSTEIRQRWEERETPWGPFRMVNSLPMRHGTERRRLPLDILTSGMPNEQRPGP